MKMMKNKTYWMEYEVRRNNLKERKKEKGDDIIPCDTFRLKDGRR